MYRLVLLAAWLLSSCVVFADADPQYVRHTNNWAVLVDTSRFWFNYRHIANALSLYHSVKRLGIPDSQIVLMLSDGMPCNARNCFPGQVFNSFEHKINLYGDDVEVDYRGTEVSVANFIKVLTGRHEKGTPASRRLDTDEHSNVFIFMTGHGGDEFLKFQDFEEIASQDIADAIEEMHVKKRYNELFLMVDTCQAGTLANALKSPNVVTAGSSRKDENSYAHGADYKVGVSLIDRFTSATLDFLEGMKVDDRGKTLQALFDAYNPRTLYSNPDYRTDRFHRPLNQVPITDFLGSVLHVELSEHRYPVEQFKSSIVIESWAVDSAAAIAASSHTANGDDGDDGDNNERSTGTPTSSHFVIGQTFVIGATGFGALFIYSVLVGSSYAT